MVQVTSPETVALSSALIAYELRATAAMTAALLTVPHLQANALRLEVLVHLVAARCEGRKKPRTRDLERWLNDDLGQAEIIMMEDPAEDVFISNIQTTEGNRRIFEGLWESSDYYLQTVMDTLASPQAPQECRDLLTPALALLRLSDTVADRLRLNRWHIEDSYPAQRLAITREMRIDNHVRAVTFTEKDLSRLNIEKPAIAPFIFRAADRQRLLAETIADSSLTQRPLIDFSDALLLSLPSAVSLAIRRFILTELRRMGHLATFQHALARRQARELDDGLQQLKRHAVPITPPRPEAQTVSLHQWLMRYDLNKYIHVVLLHDNLESLDRQGFSRAFSYPEPLYTSLQTYLRAVADSARARPDFVHGTTLIAVGGLGRGLSMPLLRLSAADWDLSTIGLPDLLMVSRGLKHPLKLYLTESRVIQ